MRVASCVSLGGDVGPGGEQVPECRAEAVHLRALQGRVGQAGTLGCDASCALPQRALARAGAPPLVSVPGGGREHEGAEFKVPEPASCPPGMADLPSRPSPLSERALPGSTHGLSSLAHPVCFQSASVILGRGPAFPACRTHPCACVSPAVMYTVPRASWPTFRRCWRTSSCRCSRPLCTLPATRSCTSSWST